MQQASDTTSLTHLHTSYLTMMKSAVAILACAASASAFTTSPATRSSSSALEMSAFDKYEGGVNFAMKDFKFDPLGLSTTFEPWMPWFRETELRHGRTAMLAVVGFITTDFVRIPGDMYSFEAIPKTIDAHDALLKTGPMYQLLFWIGLFDLLVTWPAVMSSMNGEREPGDFGLGVYKPSDAAAYTKKKNSELLNGRLAMIAIGGIATQSIVSGHGFPYV